MATSVQDWEFHKTSTKQIVFFFCFLAPFFSRWVWLKLFYWAASRHWFTSSYCKLLLCCNIHLEHGMMPRWTAKLLRHRAQLGMETVSHTFDVMLFAWFATVFKWFHPGSVLKCWFRNLPFFFWQCFHMMVLILMNMEGHMLSHLGRELIVVGILFGMIGQQKKHFGFLHHKSPLFGSSSWWIREQNGNEWRSNGGTEEDDAWRGEAWRRWYGARWRRGWANP